MRGGEVHHGEPGPEVELVDATPNYLATPLVSRGSVVFGERELEVALANTRTWRRRRPRPWPGSSC